LSKVASDRDLHLTLAQLLSSDRSASAVALLRKSIRSREVPWPDLLALASHELLAPCLWITLRDKELVNELPKSSAEYLRRAHAVNRVRNDRIKSELEEVIRRLNAADIEPVLLKGAIDLFSSRYSDPAARVLRDVDLLVPRAQHDRARATLGAIGYNATADWLETYFCELTRPGAIAPVDLHWYVSAQRDLLPPEDAIHDSKRTKSGDLRFRILSPDHQIVHNVLHSELQDGGNAVGFIWIRQLVDLVAICAQYEDQLDWSLIHARFSQHGLERVLVARLYMAHKLLGLKMPPGITPTLAARTHYQRSLGQLRWDWPLAIGRLWATGSSQFDARVIDLIYDSGTNKLRLARDRVRHAVRLIAHHGWNLTDVVRKRRMKFQ
jgi:hypothetical protein